MKRDHVKTIFAAALLLAACGLVACAGTATLARRHPEEVKEAPRCLRCHEGSYADLEHDAGYLGRHRFPGARQQQICALCHKASFCADCHAHQAELKPGDTFRDEPWRGSPHRGDYLTRHRIDGQVNPASCFRCHGRKDDGRCRQCHH